MPDRHGCRPASRRTGVGKIPKARLGVPADRGLRKSARLVQTTGRSRRPRPVCPLRSPTVSLFHQRGVASLHVQRLVGSCCCHGAHRLL